MEKLNLASKDFWFEAQEYIKLLSSAPVLSESGKATVVASAERTSYPWVVLTHDGFNLRLFTNFATSGSCSTTVVIWPTFCCVQPRDYLHLGGPSIQTFKVQPVSTFLQNFTQRCPVVKPASCELGQTIGAVWPELRRGYHPETDGKSKFQSEITKPSSCFHFGKNRQQNWVYVVSLSRLEYPVRTKRSHVWILTIHNVLKQLQTKRQNRWESMRQRKRSVNYLEKFQIVRKQGVQSNRRMKIGTAISDARHWCWTNWRMFWVRHKIHALGGRSYCWGNNQKQDWIHSKVRSEMLLFRCLRK